jgi:hypothetical protein
MKAWKKRIRSKETCWKEGRGGSGACEASNEDLVENWSKNGRNCLHESSPFWALGLKRNTLFSCFSECSRIFELIAIPKIFPHSFSLWYWPFHQMPSSLVLKLISYTMKKSEAFQRAFPKFPLFCIKIGFIAPTSSPPYKSQVLLPQIYLPSPRRGHPSVC